MQLPPPSPDLAQSSPHEIAAFRQRQPYRSRRDIDPSDVQQQAHEMGRDPIGNLKADVAAVANVAANMASPNLVDMYQNPSYYQRWYEDPRLYAGAGDIASIAGGASKIPLGIAAGTVARMWPSTQAVLPDIIERLKGIRPELGSAPYP
jgi:hypothetical protein